MRKSMDAEIKFFVWNASQNLPMRMGQKLLYLEQNNEMVFSFSTKHD